MAKKSLKDALAIKPKDDFVSAGAPVEKSTKRQVAKPPKPRPVKVTFYFDPSTERSMEQFRLKLLERGKKVTRSEVAEALVKTALKSEKAIEALL